MISTVAESQQAAFQMALLASFLPTMMLSGFVFPIASMPAPIRAITYVVPARYFLVALRSIVLKGAGFQVFWPQLVALAVYAALMLAMASTAAEAELAGHETHPVHDVEGGAGAAAGPAHLLDHLHRADPAADRSGLRRDDRRPQRAGRDRRRRSQQREPGADQPVQRGRHLQHRGRRLEHRRGRSVPRRR